MNNDIVDYFAENTENIENNKIVQMRNGNLTNVNYKKEGFNLNHTFLTRNEFNEDSCEQIS